MIKRYMKALLGGVFCLIVATSVAQQTGSFTRTVNFGGNSAWGLAYYVPTSYNAANKYKLIIGLHGLGDTYTNYRTNLASYVSTNSSSPLYNAICIVPYSGGDPNTDYWTPVSDTGIITQCIIDAMATYNIDPEYIYLNGFSLGGRSALRYGLLNYWRFRGLELWTPAVQSENEAKNLVSSFKYVFKNGKYIPTCMTVGDSDNGYNIYVPTLYKTMADSGALVSFKGIIGMGHQQPPSAEMFACFGYINTEASSYKSNDAGVVEILMPIDESCNTSFSPVAVIQNKGRNTLTAINVNYQIDGGTTNTYSWSGSLRTLDKATVTLPSQNFSTGSHTLTVTTSSPNGASDPNATNDSKSEIFNAGGNALVNTLSEGFQTSTFPPAGWIAYNPDRSFWWQRKSAGQAGGFGQSTACAYYDNAWPNVSGRRDALWSPKINFTGASNPVLTFDVAYAIQSASYPDSLIVYYSTDCGASWTKIYGKGGTALTTNGGTPVASSYFVPTTSQWRTETISLNNLVGQSKVMFSFENKSAWGQYLYIDNINLTGVAGISQDQSQPSLFNVYPNPNHGKFTLDVFASASGDFTLDVRNVLGQVVYSEKLNNLNGAYRTDLNVSQYGNGIYFVTLKSANEEFTKKVIVY